MIIHILADIIHFLKILVTCDMFFVFKRRESKCKKLMLIVDCFIVAGMSAYIYIYNNDFVETLVYILIIVLLLFFTYKEALHTLIISAVWVIFALSMIDTMVFVLFDMFTKLLGINADFLSNLAVAFVSIVLIYVIGKVYRKYTSVTLREVGMSNRQKS